MKKNFPVSASIQTVINALQAGRPEGFVKKSPKMLPKPFFA
jgi:hypothetical protein